MTVTDALAAYDNDLITREEAREIILTIAHSEHGYTPGCTKGTAFVETENTTATNAVARGQWS